MNPARFYVAWSPGIFNPGGFKMVKKGRREPGIETLVKDIKDQAAVTLKVCHGDNSGCRDVFEIENRCLRGWMFGANARNASHGQMRR